MPAVPKRRVPRSRRDRRRANTFRPPSLPTLVPCPECGEMILPYHVCPYCGHYRGRKVIEVEEE